MKTKWKGDLLQGMEELPVEQEMSIVGGQSLWFWIAYGVGETIHMVTH